MINDWEPLFKEVKRKKYSKDLHKFLDKEYNEKAIYPPRDMIFQAFKFTNPNDLKVVIIGQDPYHGPAQATGMSFSVPIGMQLPPSLRNIYKEIENDCGYKMNFENGDLTPWAKQGVLLLNAYLTVEANKPLSHKIPEYDAFIEDTLNYIDTLNQPIIFLLWGGFARKYKRYIRNPQHIILEACHPSPLAANRGGWFNQHHFTKTNDYLIANNKSPIDWRIK